MKCPNCGNENNDSAKFCKSCGASLKTDDAKIITHKKEDNNNTKIIIAVMAVVVILLAGVLLYTSGILNTEVELQNQEYKGFSLDVPVGSNFVLDQSNTKKANKLFLSYVNNGEHSEIAKFDVGNNITEKKVKADAEFVESDGNLKVYKSNDEYKVYTEGDEANIVVYGSDLNTMKRMAKSFVDDDFSKIKTGTDKAKTQETTSAQTTSSTPSSISILGGSFSTGSADADKTYARINVGTAHAGEDVIVQIFYSRDGNSLNHGNMVPATVHSDGYLEIASADAYKYYPDYATINIYDSGSHLLTTQSVSLSPTSGTQTF